jgi:hypothetical protein
MLESTHQATLLLLAADGPASENLPYLITAGLTARNLLLLLLFAPSLLRPHKKYVKHR